MTPENAAGQTAQPAGLTPENAELLAQYAGHLGRSPLTGHSPRTYLGAIRAYLAWLEQAPVDGDPLNDATAKDWAVRDYRSYLVAVAKRATATVNKHLAALQDFYVWRGLGQPQGVRRHQVPRHAPRALDPRAKLRYLRAVEAWPSARDRALALLPLYAGTRIAEIRALDVADVRLSARKGEIHLVGKGEKSRTVPMHPKLRQALAAWLGKRPSRPGADPAALFTSSRSTRMTTDAIADVIEAITRAAGIIQAFCADALSSAVNLNVDLDVVLCVLAQALTAAFRLRLPGNYAHATPDTLQRRFLDTPGEISNTSTGITVKINRRAYSPVLRGADLPADTTVPWWDGRQLHFEFA
jgi:site-specific recombinase XerC